jgi:hypothetical protein
VTLGRSAHRCTQRNCIPSLGDDDFLKGKSHKDIQNELFISLNTVKNHVSPIYRKMGVSSRWQFLEKVK